MRRTIAIIMLCCLHLCGCSKDTDIDTTTKFFEIPMTNNLYCRLEVPSSWGITQQDAFHYWQFNNEFDVYKIQTPVVTGELINNCYYSSESVSRNFEEGTVIINTDKEYLELLGMYLDSAEIVERDVLQYRELAVKYLPDYVDLPMEITNNGLYMPIDCEDVTSVAFTAANYIENESYVTSWIMKKKIEEIKPLLHSMVVCNSGSTELDWWYATDDVYVAATKDKLVAAKKLTYNQYCCYISSIDSFKDYVIKAMFNIERKE